MNKKKPGNDTKRRKPQGIPPTEVRIEITRLYQSTDTGTALAAAMTARHYSLVRSTRNVIFVIDPKGGEHNLLSRITAPREEVKKKLADLDPVTLSLKKSRQREAVIKCFLSSTENAELKTRADQAELSVSGYIRALIWGNDAQQPKASRRPLTDKQILVNLRYELRIIGGQLSQLATAQNQAEGVNEAVFAELCAEHSNVLKAILAALGKQPTS